MASGSFIGSVLFSIIKKIKHGHCHFPPYQIFVTCPGFEIFESYYITLVIFGVIVYAFFLVMALNYTYVECTPPLVYPDASTGIAAPTGVEPPIGVDAPVGVVAPVGADALVQPPWGKHCRLGLPFFICTLRYGPTRPV
jgi:hypothetical protein